MTCQGVKAVLPQLFTRHEGLGSRVAAKPDMTRRPRSGQTIDPTTNDCFDADVGLQPRTNDGASSSPSSKLTGPDPTASRRGNSQAPDDSGCRQNRHHLEMALATGRREPG